MSNTIEITDLANPEYNDLQQSILDYGKTLDVDLNRDSIMQEARNNTGLDDFGADDFIERLDILLDQWRNDPNLNQLGRGSMRGLMVKHLSTRLLAHDTWKKHPEILDIPIEKPIIVLGLPRSGTTHLLNLMAADSRFRSLPLWESYEPIPQHGEQPLEDGTDPRYKRCQDDWDNMQMVTPAVAAMHPMNPDHIHEELELMGPDIASYNYEWRAHSSNFRDHYFATDQTPHYEYMKNMLRTLMWQQKDTDMPTRWVLKCPQHLEQIPVLLKCFPDATFAVTHRDPVAVIQSTLYINVYGQRMNRNKIDMQGNFEYWTDRIEHLLKACVRDKHLLPEAQTIDVPFHEFMADDVAMVQRIYEKAGLEMTATAKAELAAFMDAHPRGKEGKVIYDLHGQFGADPAEMHERFQFYFDATPARKEVKK